MAQATRRRRAGRAGAHTRTQAGRPTRRGERRAAAAAGARRGRARQGPARDRDPGKRLSALGADARNRGRQHTQEHRAMIEETVQELTPIIGTRPACRALGAAPATIYRRRRPPATRLAQPRAVPARALAAAERQAVLTELHSERFVDSSPAQVWGDTARREPLPRLRAHDVPAAPGARPPRSAPAPCLQPPRV